MEPASLESPSLWADPLPHCTALEAKHWREGPNIHPWTVTGLSCSCRNLISFSSSRRVREGQPSGSAPVVRRQPCEVVGTGCPAAGWRRADASSATQVQVAPAPWKGTFFRLAQKQDLGQQQPCWVASSHWTPLLQVCQLMHCIQEAVISYADENQQSRGALWLRRMQSLKLLCGLSPSLKPQSMLMCLGVCVCAKSLHRNVQLCATPWTAALQASRL